MLYGGEGWVTGDQFFVWMKGAEYRVTVTDHSTTQEQANLGLIRPTPTPFSTQTTVTATAILGDVRQAIIDTGSIQLNDDFKIYWFRRYLNVATNFITKSLNPV